MLLHPVEVYAQASSHLQVGAARLHLERRYQILDSQFGGDGCRQGIDRFPGRLVELSIHQLDIEMSLNLKNELEDVNGVDPQFTAKQRFIIL
jgi:hypothetical protein